MKIYTDNKLNNQRTAPVAIPIENIIESHEAARAVVVDTATGKRVSGIASLRALSSSLMRLGNLMVDEITCAGDTMILSCSRC